MNLLDELVAIVPPPKAPTCATGDWEKVEADLGLKLPSDYKSYIARYGYGDLCKLITIDSPFGLQEPIRDHWRNVTKRMEDWLASEAAGAYPLYPTIPGLLPCGYYGDIDIISWLATGDSEKWPIVYCSRDHGFAKLDGMSLTQFLVAELQGKSPLPKEMADSTILRQPREFRSGAC